MSAPYTGNAGNIGSLTPVTTTIPVDGDPLNAASVNAALQKLTDYIAYLETQTSFGIISFGGLASSGANTSALAWLAGYLTSAMTSSTGMAIAGSYVTIPFAYRIIGITAMGTTLMVGGSVTVSAQDVVAQTIMGPSVTIGVGSNNGNSIAGPASVVAGRSVGMNLVNAGGVTTGLGQFFGMLFITRV